MIHQCESENGHIILYLGQVLLLSNVLVDAHYWNFKRNPEQLIFTKYFL